LLTSEAITPFLQVIMIDLVLAGDTPSSLAWRQRVCRTSSAQRRSSLALVRIVFAGITTQLLRLVGLLFAGGLLLLWVCWKMWRELRASVEQEQEAAEALTGYDINANGTIAAHIPRKTFVQAAGQIIVADVSMSLDNVLAVAGAAREHPIVLIFGL